MSGEPLVLGAEGPALRALARALGARLEALPDSEGDAGLEAWRERVARGTPCDRIVVAVQSDTLAARELYELDESAWARRAERPFLTWCAALGAASARCADGGAIVALADAPAALDSAGWVPETGLAEAVVALVRSLAQSEAARGVRINAVTSHGWPGHLAAETLGAVQLLLSTQASGLRGQTLRVECGDPR